MDYEPVGAELDRIGKVIVDCAYKVHTTLGPGLLEKVYKICLVHELEKRGLTVRREVSVAIKYDTIVVQDAYRIDLLVNESVVVEVKAEKEHTVFRAQTLTYIKLAELRLGYLINFHNTLVKDGISHLVV